MTSSSLVTTFFLQIALILLACQVAGYLARYIGQPAVVGEMIAGIVLGPSVFGQFAPDIHSLLFPTESRKVLLVLAQFGVGLYMFIVGMEFRRDLLLSHARGAVAVSASGMLVPFALGGGLALWLFEQPNLFGAGVQPMHAALFCGAAMAITAFPMLARIVHERGLAGTALGTLVLTAGAVDDAAAWCLLAVVLASFGASASSAWVAVLGGAAYAVAVLTLGRYALAWWAKRRTQRNENGDAAPPEAITVVLMLYALAAWTTEWLGIHAVFGGFLLGCAMPRGALSAAIRERLEAITVAFLLPLFFTYSGLNTRLDLVNSWQLFAIALLVTGAATLGKGVACYGAARMMGSDQRTAIAIGALMNARGLMELIILNIGLDRGVITPALFSIFVLMAVITTLTTTPVFALSRR